MYYIIDTTVKTFPIEFGTIPELVKHLEGTVQRKFKKNRAQYMQDLVDIGYGYDDAEGKIFTEAMREVFNIGVIKQGKYIRCNVHDIKYYGDRKNEHGN
jgi:phage tail tube protein FII